MIKFQYVHNTGQWKWNITKGAAAYETKLLEAMRTGLSGNQFTYACVNKNEFVCMTTVPGDGSAISEGTVVGVKGDLEAMREKPYCYAGRWGKNDLQESEDMPDGALPAPYTAVEYDYFPALLGPMVDAVMRGKRPVVILTQNAGESLSCIQGISYMFPKAYAEKIGFSFGATKIPDQNIRVTTDDGRSVEANVRVFFTAPGRIDVNSQSYYVFDYDPDNEVHNYKDAPSEFSKVITDYCLDEQRYMDEMAELMKPAFDDQGNVDLEMLERLSLLFRFKRTDDNDPAKLETAKSLVAKGLVDKNDQVQVVAFMEACRFVWSKGDPFLLDTKGVGKMVDAYRATEGQIFTKSDSVSLLSFLLNQDGELNADTKEVLESVAVTSGHVADEDTPVLFVNPIFERRDDVFSLLQKRLAHSGDFYSHITMISGAIQYFDIGGCFGLLQDNGEAKKGERLFSLAAKEMNGEVRTLLAAVLMASCYSTVSGEYSPHTMIRVRGLRRMLKELPAEARGGASESMANLCCLYDMQRRISDLDSCLGGDSTLIFSGLPHFLCETGAEWTEWVESLVAEVSFNELIALESKLFDIRYDGLRALVEKKLFDPEIAGSNVRRDPETLEAYMEMFAPLRGDSRYRDIAALLDQIESEGDVREDFMKFRWEFLSDANKTLADAEQAKIGFADGDPDEIAPEKREIIAKGVQARFIDAEAVKEGTPVWKRILPYVFVLGLAIVSLALMFVATKVLDGIVMKDHSTIVSRFMLLPAIATIATVLMYVFNRGMKLSRRVITTAIEALVLVVVMLLSYYGSLMLLGLFL